MYSKILDIEDCRKQFIFIVFAVYGTFAMHFLKPLVCFVSMQKKGLQILEEVYKTEKAMFINLLQ